MFLFLCSLLVLFTSFWIIIKWRRVKTFWLDRGVPHYPPHPIVGSLTFLQRENPVSFEQSDKSVFIYFSICGILWLPKQVVPIKNIVASYDCRSILNQLKTVVKVILLGICFVGSLQSMQINTCILSYAFHLMHSRYITCSIHGSLERLDRFR